MNKKMGIFLLIIATCTGLFETAKAELHTIFKDSDKQLHNPLLELPKNCHSQVDFYKVNRALAKVIVHVFIAAQVHVQCGTQVDKKWFVYGAPKGNSDLKFVLSLSKMSPQKIYLFSFENEFALRALDLSIATTLEWSQWLDREIYFWPRMLATPLMGRLCAQAAQDVVEKITNQLDL